MKNNTFVCWECQVGHRHNSKCKLCGRPMQFLIDKFRIPPRGNKGKWKKFKELVVSYNAFHKRGYEVYCMGKDWGHTYKLLQGKEYYNE